MPATTNKQKVLANLFTTLQKKYHPPAPTDRPVFEQMVYAIVREGAPRDAADRGFRNLREKFVDWNEVRVSSVHEIAEMLEGVPQPGARAQRIIDLLQEVFETSYSFDLEPLHKKGLKQAEKQIGRYQAANDFVVAWAVQRSLGGHAIPMDGPAMLAVQKLGLIDDPDVKAARASLEHLVPKAKAVQFVDLINAYAHDECVDPPAPRARKPKSEPAAPVRKAKPKSR